MCFGKKETVGGAPFAAVGWPTQQLEEEAEINVAEFIWGATFVQVPRTGDIKRTSFVEYKEELGSGIFS